MKPSIYKVKVHAKGLIVLPAEVRRRLGVNVGDVLELTVDSEGTRLKKPPSLIDAFGEDGEKALMVEKLTREERRREVEKEFSEEA